VNVLKGVWYCYACGATGKVEDYVPSTETLLRGLDIEQPPHIYPEEWLNMFDGAGNWPSPYWSQRYGKQVAANFRCGTMPLTGYPTYPMRSLTGDLWGVITRTDGQPKYRYPWNVRASQTLFFGTVRGSDLLLVEGASGVMALDEIRNSIDNITLAGVFGSNLHFPQIQHIRTMAPRRILLGFDADKAGRNGMDAAMHHLNTIAPVVSVDWSRFDPAVADPGDLTARQRIDILDITYHESHL
jgi:hypothetical protein